MPNRLAHETSPYLLQHADNPVDWWPWSADAFEEARRRGVPVLLSVGYSSCHWCHVMAHESFEDEATAALMNERFVNIKVDREERPDVDAVYMEAVQAATGQGGWPMTVFLTPEAEPFYFGTYFPPEPRHGMASFPQILEGVAQAWAERKDEVAEVAAKIVGDLAGRELPYGDTEVPGEGELAQALLGLTREYDAASGGFGGAPKFPPSMVIEFLLRHCARTGAEGALQMADDTCERMARGGIYDQLGGGFARYSVDREWVVPHFEKMLYDNALLCRAYAHLWRATGSETARRVALETADFMVRELRTNEGGFASALDADSEDAEGRHVEGAFYVWTPEQLREVLGDADAELAAQYFGVTQQGTFEEGVGTPTPAAGRGVRRRTGRGRTAQAVRGARRAAGTRTGRQDRRRVERPGDRRARGDRRVLRPAGPGAGRTRRRRSARTAPHGRAGAHRPYQQGRPRRRERRGPGGLRGCRRGLPHAGVRDRRGVWLEFAGFLLDHVLDQFTDAESGALFDTAADAEQLIRRPQDPTDNATPSGWSAAAARCSRTRRRPVRAPPHRRRAGVGRRAGARSTRAAFHRARARRRGGAARRAEGGRRRRRDRR